MSENKQSDSSWAFLTILAKLIYHQARGRYFSFRKELARRKLVKQFSKHTEPTTKE